MLNEFAEQLNRHYKDRLTANRLGLLLMGSIVLNILQGIAVAGLFPLKERIPYFVVTRSETGEVHVSDLATQRFNPSEMNVKYFAARFIRQLLTIDPYRSKSELLPAAHTALLSKGKAEFAQFLSTDHTLEKMDKDPSLARQVQIQRIIILPSAENVISADVRLTTLSAGSAPITTTKTVTLHYALMPIADEKQAINNPIGFYVTQFSIDEELGQ